jgi:hypothetical protein
MASILYCHHSPPLLIFAVDDQDMSLDHRCKSDTTKLMTGYISFYICRAIELMAICDANVDTKLM